jgi:hypothetical protein
MIPIQPKPEPSNFKTAVRDPGELFLAHVPRPSKKDWNENALWDKCFNDLYREYRGICAYLGMWINAHDATVDHFLPKSVYPQCAYEWENYRLSCEKANGYKADHDILDPFKIQKDSFILDFPSLLVKANRNLLAHDSILVNGTIEILKLNNEDFILDRLYWIKFYIENLDFQNLEQFAPFIAYELKRQKLENDIIEMMHVQAL